MSHDHFNADWLALREPADHAARSAELEAKLQTALQPRIGPWKIVDLGAGTGSNARHLAARLKGQQHWRLLDHDAVLLERAQQELTAFEHPEGYDVTFDFDLRSLECLESALDEPCDLITASALIDLVSARWLAALVDRVTTLDCNLLITLSVDGKWNFTDRNGELFNDGLDAQMLDTYRAHQNRDKGLGTALGGDAPEVLADLLRGKGLIVATQSSNWHLRAGGQIQLMRHLLNGWHKALESQAPDDAEKIRTWAADRDRAISAGHLGINVGHVDLLALSA